MCSKLPSVLRDLDPHGPERKQVWPLKPADDRFSVFAQHNSVTNIQVVKIIDLRLHCRCIRIVQSYSPDGSDVHPMQYMFPSIHTSLPSKCISICSSFSRDLSVCLAEITEHVICVAIGRIYILWPTSGQGCSLKKEVGTPETRLWQTFFNNLGLDTRTLIHVRKIATADLWSCPAIQLGLLVFECL